LVTVVENPSITATVGPDGSFVLRGLPTDGFTLLFTQEGVELGTLAFTGLLPNQQIRITVEIVDGEVVLRDERRTGIGHGAVEVQGDVEIVLQLDSAGDSLFQIYSHLVLARPGVTAIREGGEARGVEDVVEGRQAHVKGVWLEPTDPAAQQVILAHEIILQEEEEGDDVPAGGQITICHIPPGNPDARHTQQIDASAWPAHQAHGDTLGPCS